MTAAAIAPAPLAAVAGSCPDARLVVAAAGVLELRRDGQAPVCAPDQVLIRNRRTLVSPGTELACLAGLESSWFPFGSVPGYCAAGEIVAVGAEVQGWSAGERVLHYGGHRQWQAAVPGRDFLCRLPEGVEWDHAPFARLATIAMTALRQAHIELGDDVLVTGLGLVGNLAAQLAALQGAAVTALDPAAERVAFARACGLDGAITGTATSGAAAAQTACARRGFSALIEASGRAATLVEALPLLARGAEVMLLGTPRAAFNTDLAAVLRSFHLADRALTLRAAHEWVRPVEDDRFVKHSFARDSRVALAAIASGRLAVAPLITHRIRPEQAPAVYRELAAGGAGIGAVVIGWEGN
jgi:2-desacetyl-2-hydroxyethyl bacteriochlorophyllide A dehydrogenase